MTSNRQPKFYEYQGDIWFGVDWDGEAEDNSEDFSFLSVDDEYSAVGYAEQLNENQNIKAVALLKMGSSKMSKLIDAEAQTKPSKLETLKSSGKTMANAAFQGGQMAAIQRANNVAYDKVSHLLEQHFGLDGDKLQDPAIKKIIMMAMPFVLHPLISTFEDKIPHADFFKKCCELQVTATTMEMGGAVFDFMNELMVEMKLAAETPSTSSNEQKSIDYSTQTVVELKKLCQKRHISLPSRIRKNDLIELLKEADQKILSAAG